MSGWSYHQGQVVCLSRENIDTDQIIPARFMSQPRAAGYANFLLHDVRRDESGELDPDFVLNRYPNASVLLAGRNFGSGSSREAAVYALVDAGFHAVIAPGFGDIFAANAVNNGLLPACVDEDTYNKLLSLVDNAMVECTVNLEKQTIAISGILMNFTIDQSWRTKLINGWDDIDLTLQQAQRIAHFRQARKSNAQWSWPQVDKPGSSAHTHD